MALNESGLNYPVDIRRRIDRAWQRRFASAPARVGNKQQTGTAKCIPQRLIALGQPFPAVATATNRSSG